MIAQCKNYDLGCQGKDIKECRTNLAAVIAVEMEKRNNTLDGIAVAPSNFYNILAPVDFDYIQEINGVVYSFNCSVILNPKPSLGAESNDNPEDYELIRHPIFLSDNTVIVVSTFQSKDGLGLGKLFLSDYFDHRRQTKIAMKDLVAQIADHMSINSWWTLKEAINEQIDRWNKRRSENHPVKQWPYDRPKDQ
jgi:hypothetical protein